jgi:hypothetical protein
MGFTHHKIESEHYNLTICKPQGVGKIFLLFCPFFEWDKSYTHISEQNSFEVF